MTRLTSNMRIGGDEVGDKPPAPEKALTIFAQTPGAGSTIDPKKNVVVTVKRYGSSKSTEEGTPPPFDEQPTGAVTSAGLEGTWGGNLALKGEGKPNYMKFNVRRNGDAYIIYTEKGDSIPMKGGGNMLVYEDKLNFDLNLFGGKSAPNDPVNIRVTATLVSENELQIWFKAWSSSGQKEGVLGTLARLK